jgi:hypothetical protein
MKKTKEADNELFIIFCFVFYCVVLAASWAGIAYRLFVICGLN